MKGQRPSLAARWLLSLALLCLSAPAAAARPAGRRQLLGHTLQQPAAPTAQPAALAPPAAEPSVAAPLSEQPLNATAPAELAQCEALVEDLQNSCSVSLDRIALNGYGRGADTPPTASQVAATLTTLESAGLPPRKCCAAAAALSSSTCACNLELVDQLHNWLNEQAGVEFEFIQGALAIIDMAEPCSNPVPACLAIDGVHAQDGTR